MTVPSLWTDRHAIGAAASRTRAPAAGIVAHEGGGSYPTLELGGGAGFLGTQAGWLS